MTIFGMLLVSLLLVSGARAQGFGPLKIHDLQGRSHRSPFFGRQVTVTGIITSVDGSLASLQGLPGESDGNPATSEAIFVRLAEGSRVTPGDLVTVSGRVDEFNPGGVRTNLTLTRIEARDPPTTLGRRDLPPPVVLGKGGRAVPSLAIDDDSHGPIERAAGAFDPDADALDFFESLEAMRVAVPDALAVGATSPYGELVVLANGGEGNPSLSGSALVIAEGDFNPERVMVKSGHFDQERHDVPVVPAGTRFKGDLVGVVSYSYGNPKLLLSEPAPEVVLPEVAPAHAPLRSQGTLRIASYNVENLSPASGREKFDRLGEQIVAALGSPDLIALQEIQDGSGPEDDGVTSGMATLELLIQAIDRAGGPSYQALEIAPENDADGGQPGGNIRVAFLVRVDGGLEPVLRPGGAADVPVHVQDGPSGAPRLSCSPGRVAPGDPAWRRSRKPLALELRLGSSALFVVDCHLRSKGGDTPLFGAIQPPERGSEAQRSEQTTLLADFARQILTRDPDALLVVLGDMNDFSFSAPMQHLASRGGLMDLVERLPASQRWSYIYQGNAQELDHVLVSPALLRRAVGQGLSVVHLNAPFPDAISDHDPTVFDFSAD